MKLQAPNWPQVIDEIVASGMTELEISKQPGVDLTLRAVRHLQTGVQPLFRRGDTLITLWCNRTGKARADVPMADVPRGHRKARPPADHSPKVQALPAWPPAQRTDMQGKPRRKVKEPA